MRCNTRNSLHAKIRFQKSAGAKQLANQLFYSSMSSISSWLESLRAEIAAECEQALLGFVAKCSLACRLNRDAANLIKPALARGELRCMGATTLAEYREHIEKDGALERRFAEVRFRFRPDRLISVTNRWFQGHYQRAQYP